MRDIKIAIDRFIGDMTLDPDAVAGGLAEILDYVDGFLAVVSSDRVNSCPPAADDVG
jgi:hypothetical protein